MARTIFNDTNHKLSFITRDLNCQPSVAIYSLLSLSHVVLVTNIVKKKQQVPGVGFVSGVNSKSEKAMVSLSSKKSLGDLTLEIIYTL